MVITKLFNQVGFPPIQIFSTDILDRTRIAGILSCIDDNILGSASPIFLLEQSYKQGMFI